MEKKGKLQDSDCKSFQDHLIKSEVFSPQY